MIGFLGWVATALVLIGFLLNTRDFTRKWAFISWIVGDILWVIYDFYILNWSHLSLSAIIIIMNIYGFKNISYRNGNDIERHNNEH